MKQVSQPGPSQPDIAQAMRAFYERYPYPPAVRDLGDYKRLWRDPARRRVEAALCWPHEPFRQDRRILVAGCGTSQAARYAIKWPKASVTAIDISAESVGETEKLKRNHRLENLAVHQRSVEEAPDLGEEFDHIVCTGVLHHLPDPERGLRALRAVMTPNAALQLMVYAPHGRAGIYMMQDYFRRTGVKTTERAVETAQASLRFLPRDHPLAPLLGKSPDFGTEAGFADALLNPIDRPYSVPELYRFLAAGGFKFGRWLRQAPYLFDCGLLAQSLDRERIAALPAVDRYAAAELFRGTMVEHTAIVHRDDLDVQPHCFIPGDDAFGAFVPLTVPTSVVVTERLPPGAAAVLINCAHTFTDLYLPINQSQVALFQAIDGTKDIATLIARSDDAESARTFLATLWQYDQIVVQAPCAT